MANIIVIGGKIDDQFHTEINKHAAGGYQAVLMSSVAKEVPEPESRKCT